MGIGRHSNLFAFYDSQTHKLGYFEGYPPDMISQIGVWATGRVFTKELLNDMTSGFSKGNRSMDQSIKGALQGLKIDATERLLTDPKHLPIGEKQRQTFWSAKSYKTTNIRNPKWLPYDIWEQIEDLSFDEN